MQIVASQLDSGHLCCVGGKGGSISKNTIVGVWPINDGAETGFITIQNLSRCRCTPGAVSRWTWSSHLTKCEASIGWTCCFVPVAKAIIYSFFSPFCFCYSLSHSHSRWNLLPLSPSRSSAQRQCDVLVETAQQRKYKTNTVVAMSAASSMHVHCPDNDKLSEENEEWKLKNIIHKYPSLSPPFV